MYQSFNIRGDESTLKNQLAVSETFRTLTNNLNFHQYLAVKATTPQTTTSSLPLQCSFELLRDVHSLRYSKRRQQTVLQQHSLQLYSVSRSETYIGGKF